LALMYRTYINSIPLSGIIAQIISQIWIIKKERFCPGEHTDLVVCSYSMYGSLGAFGK
jgi:hypothetical protein